MTKYNEIDNDQFVNNIRAEQYKLKNDMPYK